MKRERRLTKRERKAQNPATAAAQQQAADGAHIHCIACGRHIDAVEFTVAPPLATRLRCDHGSMFPACAECVPEARARIAEHDRTGQGIRTAGAWH